MGELFGTDGVRGVAGTYPLDSSTIFKLGRALVRSGWERMLIGRDTRASGPWIGRILEEGITSQGGSAVRAEVMTTPGVAVLTDDQGLDAGIVVSASHNPYRDNGIKIFSAAARKIGDDEQEWIETAISRDSESGPSLPQLEDAERDLIQECDEALVERYIHFLRSRVPGHGVKPLRVVLDCANGAAFHIAPRIFEAIGAEVVVINATPDGRNINLRCGAVHPESMAQAVLDSGASLGVAFDGDADRAIFSNEKGEVLDGDHVLFILSRFLRTEGRLNSGCVVGTVMSNKGLEVALAKEDLKLIRTSVGDRNILEAMMGGGYELGGEPSGHIILKEDLQAGDGILTALKILGVMQEMNSSLSRSNSRIREVPSGSGECARREEAGFFRNPCHSRGNSDCGGSAG